MKSPRDPWVYVDYISESVRFIQEYSSKLTLDKFLSDHQAQDAIIRRFQVMGDAAKSIPESFKAEHAEIPWREMMAQRDVLVHDYFDINFERLWRTVQNEMQVLNDKISRLKSNQPNDK